MRSSFIPQTSSKFTWPSFYLEIWKGSFWHFWSLQNVWWMSQMNGAMASFTRPWVLYNSVDKASHYKVRGSSHLRMWHCFLWPKFMTKFATSFFVNQNNYRVSKVVIVFHNVFMTMKPVNTLNITWITASKMLLIIIYSTIVFWLTLSVACNKKMKTVRLRWEPLPRIKFAHTGQDLKGKHIYLTNKLPNTIIQKSDESKEKYHLGYK